jgi:hypothetical protein
LDHIKLGPFRISKKITEVNYELDLLVKMKIYLVQYIVILKPAHRNHKPPLYKADTYKGREEDKWEIQKVIDY